MPAFSKRSHEILYTCCEELHMLFYEIIKDVDCKAISGYRNEAEQNKVIAEGTSKTPYPRSKHNVYLSDAIDIVPYPELYSDNEKFYWFGGYVICKARQLGINIRWGGDWDGDMNLKDQNFYDLAHFEIKR